MCCRSCRLRSRHLVRGLWTSRTPPRPRRSAARPPCAVSSRLLAAAGHEEQGLLSIVEVVSLLDAHRGLVGDLLNIALRLLIGETHTHAELVAQAHAPTTSPFICLTQVFP